MLKRDKNLIFFDFDGVIADTFEIAYSIMHKKFPSLPKEKYREGSEMNINEAIKVWKKHGLATKQLPAFDFFKEYTPRTLRLNPIPGVPQAIRLLQNDFKLLIISSTISSSIRRFLKKHRLDGYFGRIYGNEIQASKIKKFRLAMHTYHVRPQNCIFITDTLGDINEARRVSVSSLAVTWGYHSPATLKKGSPYKLLSKPSQLRKAVNRFFAKPS
ncbi:MAG: HAD hydrolase-like protein [Patescibacteria group bacterium]|nr:HAD hydrolase-like protein [Patescibacteria group bacterium]